MALPTLAAYGPMMNASSPVSPSIVWPEPKQAPTHLGSIDYHDVGDGPPIVFLHLILTAADHWDQMPPLLADRYRCIVPTLPMGAHRLAAVGGADLSIPGLARAVADLLTHLDLHDVTLVGNDTGGAIAQLVAADHPERLARVVLTNCDMYDSFPPKIFSFFRLLPKIPGAMALTARLFKVEPLWRLPFVFGRLTNEVEAAKIHGWADALGASKAVRRDANTVIRHISPDVTNAVARRLTSSEVPFLVAWGADDKAFVPALAERFCREIPTAELVMIPDCKALVCWDQPERLAELIDEFAS